MSKIKFTREYILEKACELGKDVGLAQLNVRMVAKAVGCSVAPIYTAFGDFQHLLEAVSDHFKQILLEYNRVDYSENSFLNIGVGLVAFANDYPNVFMDILLKDPSLGAVDVDDEMLAIMRETHLIQFFTEEELFRLLETMGFFTYGLCMLLVSDPHAITLDECYDRLMETGRHIIMAMLLENGNLQAYKAYRDSQQQQEE